MNCGKRLRCFSFHSGRFVCAHSGTAMLAFNSGFGAI